MRISIIGLGLVGGSIGLALKRTNWEGVELIGYTRRQEAASRALELKAVDSIETSLKAAVEGTDLVVIATPVMVIKEILQHIAPNIRSQCVITDTASTKSQVMEWAKISLPPEVSFIGGHPMAGKEASGIESAEAELFHGCTYCLCPSPNATPEAVHMATILVERIGAKPLLIDAWEHDNLVAGTSHLPILLSAALVSATTNNPSWPRMSPLAASGYRDLTRLASGNPKMNSDICLTNQEPIVHWIDAFTKELGDFRRLIIEGSYDLEKAFITTQQARQSWLKKK